MGHVLDVEQAVDVEKQEVPNSLAKHFAPAVLQVAHLYPLHASIHAVEPL